MAEDNGGDPGNGSADANGHSSFDAAAWSPDDRAYGLFYLMVIRQGMDPDKIAKPVEIQHLKFVDSRQIPQTHSKPTRDPQRRRDEAHSEDEESDDVSEGEPFEESEQVTWPGKRSSWWRVHNLLGEDLVIRQGLSIASAELRRISPGELVQQAGAARSLVNGRARGGIRLPVKPRGWVTADASRAGGPRYLVPASAPRWRVVYSNPNSNEPDAIVRADPALNSDEVSVLYCGDVVEQAGPSETRGQGIVRMPVTAAISKRNKADGGDSPRNNHDKHASSKILGWVTVDATPAGGPIFFKLAPDVDSKRRRRQPGWS